MLRMLTTPVVAAALVALLSCSSKPDFNPNPAYHSTRFPETRTMNEAKLWLYWRKGERIAFIRGLVVAYRDAAVRGCLHAFEHMSQTPAENRANTSGEAACSQEGTQFDRDVSDYEISMTSYYETYPQDD